MKPMIVHRYDGNRYVFRNVAPQKYENWLRMTHGAERDPRTEAPRGYPFQLQVEVTSRCNLACPLCPAGAGELDRPAQDMPPELFRALVDDMAPYLLFLVLWEWGEPFIHPSFPDMVRYASDRGIQSITSTNGHFLRDEDYLRDVLTSGLGTLVIALDSLDQERYAAYRVNGDVEGVKEGVKRVAALKRTLGSPTVINLRMVVSRNNEQEIDAMRQFARESGVDKFTVKTINPCCGSKAADGDFLPRNPALRRHVYDESLRRIRKKHPVCRKLWQRCHVLSNGDVVPCGYDYNAGLKIGNLADTPLSKLWRSPRYAEVRELVSREIETLPLCRECTVLYETRRGASWVLHNADFAVPLHGRLGRWAERRLDARRTARAGREREALLRRDGGV